MANGMATMRILYITSPNPRAQGDLQEVTLLHGLRNILGIDCIDIPRKRVMYGDFSETTKEELHGRGFTMYNVPLQDLLASERELRDIDFVLHGATNANGLEESSPYDNLVPSNRIWYIDGHDLFGYASRMIHVNGQSLIGVQRTPCFKRELLEDIPNAYPTGFGIPKSQIRPINLSKKNQLYQKTAPDASLFRNITDLGGSRVHHKFTHEEDYYTDLSRSWFGLTCMKGGWDCLRHYEIIAAGTLLLFRDYKYKPVKCSPQNLPCFSYSSKEELEELMNRLVLNNKPTKEYFEMLMLQRKWLYNVGTTEVRAMEVIRILNENSN